MGKNLIFGIQQNDEIAICFFSKGKNMSPVRNSDEFEIINDNNLNKYFEINEHKLYLVALPFNNDFKVLNSLTNNFLINFEDVKDNFTVKNNLEKSIDNNEYNIVLVSEESLNKKQAGTLKYSKFGNEITYYITDFDIDQDIKQIYEGLKKGYNNPKKIETKIEVYNPDVEGLKHIDIVRKKLILEF